MAKLIDEINELEREIIAVLARARCLLSSTEINERLPAKLRPRGKNALCLVLAELARLRHIERHGSSKRYTRYCALGSSQVDFAYWPYTGFRRQLED